MSGLYGSTSTIDSTSKTNTEIDNSKVIGPTVPPHLLNKRLSENVPSSTSNDDCNDSDENDSFQENNMTEAKSGPALPPHLLNKASTSLEQSKDIENSNESTKVTTQLSLNVEQYNSPDSSTDAFGPALPPHLQSAVEENSDDEDVYGPLPPGAATSSHVYQALEERALQIKLGQLDSSDDKGTVREEWMIELPEVRTGNLGLRPRQFRKNQRPDFSDRSSWTDTAEQKLKKSQGKNEVQVDLKKEAELQAISKRDDEQGRLAEKHNRKKKRDKSLLEMHQDQLKKKKKEETKEGVPTRRPFSREIDLKVNQFDDAQKKSILKKAMHLDDRFSGGQSKFL